MWRRNLLFGGLSLAGLAAVAAGLIPRGPVQPPRDFDAQRYQRADYREVLDRVDREFEGAWKRQGLQVAPRADDWAIARRISLGLTGTIPSLEEIRALESVPGNERIEWWLSRLLEDRRYADYVAERLARTYVGTDNGPFIVYRRRRFVTWLSDQLHANRPYDEIARELITGTGLWTNNPAVNFLTVTLDQEEKGKPDPIRLAGRTTRAFLGMRIDCLQCHEDKLGNIRLGTPDKPRDGLQSDFHHLAAFYSGAEFSLFGVTDGDDAYEYKYLDAEAEERVDPISPYRPDLVPPSGTRREQLADWVTHEQNQPFARAIVNRVWALMFGKPLVEPIDDIPLFGDYPPGLETLARDFTAHGCDLRRLVRLIAGTKAFQLDSRADFEVLPRHEQHWAVFPLTRLRPEQMAGGIIQASSLTTIDADAHIIAQLRRFGEQNEFVRRYGDTGEDEFEDRAGTVSQRLLVMNGELVKQRTKEDLVNAAGRIAQLAPTNEQAVETAYLATLTRRPSPQEQAHFVQLLRESTGGKRTQVLEDLYWVLVNSTEFSWNH